MCDPEFVARAFCRWSALGEHRSPNELQLFGFTRFIR
jgi:hypothetical protein